MPTVSFMVLIRSANGMEKWSRFLLVMPGGSDMSEQYAEGFGDVMMMVVNSVDLKSAIITLVEQLDKIEQRRP